jgi:hypothetical protein
MLQPKKMKQKTAQPDGENPSYKIVLHTLSILLIALSFYHLSAYLFVALSRMSYPYGLEWIEGSVLEHAQRILQGRPIYVEPGLGFIPYLYTPLYYYMSALVLLLAGKGFFALRLLSFLASVGSALVILQFVKTETKSLFCALLSAGFFFATYQMCGAWFDLARVDSLFLFLMLLSLYLLKSKESIFAFCAAGVFSFLAFMTKQSALPIIGFVSCYLFLFHRWKGLYYFGSAMSLICASVLILYQRTSGWFWYYCFDMPSQHPFTQTNHDFFVSLLLKNIPISLAFIPCIFAIFALKKNRKQLGFFSLVLASSFTVSWSSYLRAGGYINTVMPLNAILAIMLGVGFHAMKSSLVSSHSKNAKLFIPAVLALLVCQFTWLIYNPMKNIPTKADRSAGDRLLNIVQKFEGDVYIPSHDYLAVMGGKESFAHTAPWLDIIRTHDTRLKEKIIREFTEAVDSRQFDAIILDTDRYPLLPVIEKTYKYSGSIFSNDDFYPLTGVRTRPDLIYLPID